MMARRPTREFRLAPGTIHRSNFHVDRPKGLPDRVYRGVLQAFRDRSAQNIIATRTYRNQAEKVTREYLRRLHSVIGTRNMPKYLEFRNRSIDEMLAARRRLPESEQGMRKLAEIGRGQAAKSLIFMKNLGVDTNRIRRLQETFQKRKRALLDARIRKEVAASRVARTKNKTFYPPFDGWLWVLNEYEHLYDPTAYLWTWPGKTPLANPATGNVGFASTLGVCWASDEDQVSLDSRASVVQWYQIPKPGGKLAVRIRAKLGGPSNLCHHSGNISGGGSFGGIQSMELIAIVYSQGAWSGAVSWKVFDRIDQYAKKLKWKDDSFVGNLAPGQTRDFGPSIVLPGKFSAGTWVAVEAGVVHLNDVDSYNASMMSTVEAAATIKELGLSVVP